jgi:hypothetical protein
MTQSRLRVALYLLTGLAAATFIMVFGLNAFYCQPISSNWFTLVLFVLTFRSLSTENQCINCGIYAVFFPSVIANILVDILSIAHLLYCKANGSFHPPLFPHPKTSYSKTTTAGARSHFQSWCHRDSHVDSSDRRFGLVCHHISSRSLDCTGVCHGDYSVLLSCASAPSS